MKIINIALSGNTKLYAYTADEAQLINRNVGDCVVIPNKTKDDGSLSLSIGKFAGLYEELHDGTGLKPIVTFIDATDLRAAQVKVLALEAKVAA